MAADVSIIVETNAKEVGNEFTGMAGQIVGTVAKVQMLQKTMDKLSDAMNSGRIDGQQYSKAIAVLDKAEDQLYASIGKANTAVKAQSAVMDQASASTARASGTMSQAAVRAQQMAAAQRMAGKSTNKFGLVSQQVGYQVGDFFVQVQSGTDALVAFGQQGTQLAGLLPGLAGAILGIGLSLGTAMLNASLTAKGLRVDFKAVFEDLKKAVEPIQPLIDAMGNALSYMGQIAVTVLKSLIDNLDRVIAYVLSLSLLITSKLVFAFIASGNAAKAFFAIIRAGLISTGIGALVVLLGEIILQFTKLVRAAGGFGTAIGIVGELAQQVFTSLDTLSTAAGYAIAGSFKYGLGVAMEAFGDFGKYAVGILNSIIIGLKGLSLIPFPMFKVFKDLETIDPVTSAESFKQEGLNDLEIARGLIKSEVPSVARIRELLSKLGDKTSVDTSDWLVPDTDDKDGKGAKDSMKTFMQLLDKLKGETANQEKLLGVYGEKREVLEQVISFEDELKRKLTETEVLKLEQAAREKYRIEERGQLLESVSSNIKSAFMTVVDGSKSVVDAFRSMLRNILLAVYEQQVAQPAANAISSFLGNFLGGLGGGSAPTSSLRPVARPTMAANGRAYVKGVEMFANGGVVNAPTGFRHSGGLGIMGEAGPEAIMPLKRGKNGKLGVQMEGGSQPVVVNQTFHFQANGDESVKRIIGQSMPQIAQYTSKTIVDQRRKGGSMKAAFRG